MSDTDIYKNRPRLRQVQSKPKRRRRTSSRLPFDETPHRRRRSSNSGLRRLLHLYRKPENEKRVWWGILIAAVIILIAIAIWQFVYREHVIRKNSRQKDINRTGYSQPETGSSVE